MYCYIDESGNTGLELFDKNQPTLYYGLLSARTNLDVIAEPMLKELRQSLGVKRIHANELGVARLTNIAGKLTHFSKKNDLRFSMLRVEKQDHSIISFFDQVFDSGMNRAVPWHHYFTPLRYILLLRWPISLMKLLRKTLGERGERLTQQGARSCSLSFATTFLSVWRACQIGDHESLCPAP